MILRLIIKGLSQGVYHLVEQSKVLIVSGLVDGALNPMVSGDI